MNNRDPNALLHDQLLKLQASEEWQIYRGILNEQYRAIYNELASVLSTPEQVAAHNVSVGVLAGIKKTLDYLRVKIAELERKEANNGRSNG